MIRGSLLRSELVRCIRGIPAVIALLDGDPENVMEFVDQEEGDLHSEIMSLAGSRTLLVSLRGGGEGGEQMQAWTRDFELFFQAKGDPEELIQELLDGVTAASGFGTEPFIRTQFHPRYNSPTHVHWERRSVAVSEKSNFDYWELTFSLLSRGTE